MLDPTQIISFFGSSEAQRELISYLTSVELQRTFFPLKIVIGIISLFMLWMIFYVLARTQWLRLLIIQDLIEIITFKAYGPPKITRAWAKIAARLETVSESEYKLAIIEADDLLNEVLKRLGYMGETLGERLKQLNPVLLPNLDQVQEAHKIRNNIVHDPDYRLSLDQARKTLEIYEKAFRDLQAL